MSASKVNIFKIPEVSKGYGWGIADDPNYIVVWKGDWYEVLPANTIIEFVDIKVKHHGFGCFEVCKPDLPDTGGGGKTWGDPWFYHKDGSVYEVHGEDGKYYNILSDLGVQVNAKFGGRTGVGTWLKEIGITIGSDQISITNPEKYSGNGEGVVTINGQTLLSASGLNGAVVQTKWGIVVKAGEYELTIKAQTTTTHYFDIAYSAENVASDGMMPHGLWGQALDGDDHIRYGRSKQGGGAIEDAAGRITAKDDVTTYKIYEVDGLFDTDFTVHNRFHERTDFEPAARPTIIGTNAFSGGTGEGAVVRLSGDAEEYSWSLMADGNNITVSRDSWSQVLNKHIKLQFDDKLVDPANADNPSGDPVLKIDGNSGDYGWGNSEDGSVLVVWRGDWFELVKPGTDLEFNDRVVEIDEAGKEIKPKDTNASFEIDGNSSDYGWGNSEDGSVLVVWRGDWFELLDTGTDLKFKDRLVKIDENGKEQIEGDGGNANANANAASAVDIAGKIENYDWGRTEDGEDFVVWSTDLDWFTIVEDDTLLRFNDQELVMNEMAL